MAKQRFKNLVKMRAFFGKLAVDPVLHNGYVRAINDSEAKKVFLQPFDLDPHDRDLIVNNPPAVTDLAVLLDADKLVLNWVGVPEGDDEDDNEYPVQY